MARARDIEEREKPYHPSQLTRFRNRVGPERLERIITGLVEELIEGRIIRGETVAMDATFIKAYSKRDSRDNRRARTRNVTFPQCKNERKSLCPCQI